MNNSRELLLNLAQDLHNSVDLALALEHNNLELLLALSGGLDSVVLLDAMTKLGADIAYKLSAVYIDHQLQADSKQWLDFNKNLCAQYNIPFRYFTIDIIKQNGESIEALARTVRYKQLAQLITSTNQVLLTAHHLNDQAETFLLQLVRSAGPRGLSSMPKLKNFAGGWHWRPFLDISRERLHNYATHNNLSWVMDQSNLDLRFDRNYVRHKVIPILTERWPNIIANISHSAKNCAEHERLLNNYLAEDYQDIRIKSATYPGLWMLEISRLLEFTVDKQRALLRYWLHDCGVKLPERKIINEIINNCVNARSDKCPAIAYEQFIITRYKNKLYLVPSAAFYDKYNNIECDYTLGSVLDISELGVKISSHAQRSNKNTMSDNLLHVSANNKFTIRFRKGGERCQPIGRQGSVTLKKLLQENNIPPWLRARIPLIYVNDQLISILGVKTCYHAVANSVADDTLIHWTFVGEYY